jgi:hypothetical protein
MHEAPFERLIAGLKQMPPDQNATEYALAQIIQNASKDFGFLLRACALPHWFDASVVGVLLGKETDRDRNAQLALQIGQYAFVQVRQDGARAYHDEARAILMKW